MRRDRLGMTGYPVPQSLGWLTWSPAERGEFQEAVARGQAAVRVAEALDHPHTIVVTCRGLADAHALKGDLSQPIALFERAITLCREWQFEAAALSLTGPALARELGMRPLVAHCHLGLGTVYGRVGKPREARAELTAAADLYRAMAMAFWLTRAETCLTNVT